MMKKNYVKTDVCNIKRRNANEPKPHKIMKTWWW